MHFRKSAAVALAATAATVGAVTVSTTAAHAAAMPKHHVVTIHVNNHRVLVGKNNRIGSGLTDFRVVTHQGDHIMNIVRFRKGYSLPQFGQDINKAFGGDVKAIRRVDKGSVFNGGSEAKPGRSGEFSANLKPGMYYFFDQNSSKFAAVKVVGKYVPRTPVRTSSMIDLFTYGFGPGRSAVRHNGRTLIKNQADQPHFIEFQQVKPGTTAVQVKRYIKKGGRGQPSWALKASWGSGVLSPHQSQALALDLPKGKYLVACFWPDANTGMPHFFMGMWKLITLK